MAVVCVALAAPAVALADPGTPGVHSAQTAVYPSTPAQNVLGQQATPPANTPAATNTPAGTTTPASVPVTAATPSSPAAATNGVASIPFTGLALLAVIGCAVALLAAGTVLRLAARPRSSSS